MAIDVGPVDPELEQRSRAEGRDALAFSGGVDSCAALLLSPKSTIAVFLNRVIPHDGPPTMYRPDAAHRTLRAVSRSGYETIRVDTDMEYVRQPVGFPVDWSNAVPSILLADEFDFRSVGFGMVAESAFFLGHSHYSDLGSRTVYTRWAPLFEAADMPISLPTSGLSEVVTSTIALKHARNWHPQSCIRGTATKPCGKCFKCFRKRLLEAAIKGHKVPPEHFDKGMSSKEVRRKLSDNPVHHENVLAYSVVKMKPSRHPLYPVRQDGVRHQHC